MNNNRIPLLLHILLIVLCLFAYFWADRNAVEVHGTTCMVPGPDKTITLVVDNQIIKVSRDGDIISSLDLKAMGITEPIADLFVEPNGEMLIGLMDSQLIQRYSPEGKFQGTFSRPPSAMTPPPDGRNFKFTKDPRSGMLYVADSSHHRIQIYGPDEQEQRVISSYFAVPAANNASEEGEEGKAASPPTETTFRFPNGLAINNDRLYVTDTHHNQVVVFGMDGSFQRTYSTVYSPWTEYRYPTQLSIGNDTLYVINRGPLYLKGEVVAIPLEGSGAKRFYPVNSGINPFYLLAREDDVLIADNNSKKILRYFPDGTYAGYFGKEPLLTVFSGLSRRVTTYTIVRLYSLAGMLIILVSLLFLKRKDCKAREALGLPSVYQSVAAFQEILGPKGSRRRSIMFYLVPGLGYAAAGRALRAIILLPVLLICIILFIICALIYILNGVIYLWPAMASALIAAAVWVGIVLDGKRLADEVQKQPNKFDLLNAITTLTVPLITVAGGITGQLIREKYLNSDNRELAHAINDFFQKVMVFLHFLDKPSFVFTTFQPASAFLGWGGASAALFAALAWKSRQTAPKIAIKAVFGFIVGMASWTLTATYPGTMLGSAYYIPLSQGILISTAIYVIFRKEIGSWIVIPAGILGAWIGAYIHLFFRFPLPFVNPGASIRATSVAFQAYFIHIAILIVITQLRRKQQVSASAAAVL